MVKTCTLCKKIVEVSEMSEFRQFFYYSKKGKFGFASFCISCAKAEKKKFFKKFPEKMNPNKVQKKEQIPCIVCDNTFQPKHINHKTCCKECEKIKNRVRRKLHSRKESESLKQKRANEIKKATTRNKHYTKDEKIKIARMLNYNYDYTRIAKKMGRTSTGIGKIARKILKEGI